MTTRTSIIIVVIAIILVGLFVAFVPAQNMPGVPGNSATSTSDASSTDAFDQTTSDGVMTFGYPGEVFGLATNPTQILVKSYIPPCDPNFDYCLYYTGDQYKGTNFESAGIRIQKRKDLTSEQACLATAPSGYSADKMPDATTTADTYSSSEFSDIGDAAAGHTASGSLFRVYVKDPATCYEFQTRVGESQYANYPAGTITEFTDSDRSDVELGLKEIVDQFSLVSGQTNLLP